MFYENTPPLKSANYAGIPEPDLERFQSSGAAADKMGLLAWGDHCTECALPDCYKSCAFYQPRHDLRCGRLEGGIRPVHADRAGGLIAVKFGKWARLVGMGKPYLYGSTTRAAILSGDKVRRWVVDFLPLPFYVEARLGRIEKYLQLMLARMAPSKTPITETTYFLVEGFNPQPKTIHLRISFGEALNSFNYTAMLEFEPGYNMLLVPSDKIFNRKRKLPESLTVEILPSSEDERIEILFRQLDFVAFEDPASLPAAARLVDDRPLADQQAEPDAVDPSKAVKCVVWDLDNTMWDGVLIEDGIEGIKLRQQSVDTIKALDQRGIVNSIASKNDWGDAQQALQRFGLEEFFVYPQVHWEPKSHSVQAIQRSLNIGIDTMVFVDDQPFERAEVESRCPAVQTFDIHEIEGLLSHPRFDVEITEDSRLRRKRYQEQAQRDESMGSSGDYEDFLRSCEIVVEMKRLDEDLVPRVHELAQRTNQMNFSGNRYSLDKVDSFRTDERFECWTIAASDRFGSYGVVAFVIVELELNRIIDLAMSCRIQKKMVDHAILCFLMERYKDRGRALSLKYRPTKRNRAAAGLFADVGFKEEALDDDMVLFTLPEGAERPTNDIVSVNVV